MQFIAAPILGELSDAYGCKKLLRLGVGALAVSQALFGFGVGIASVALLFVARALAGIAAGNLGIAQAAIADVTEPKDRAKHFGLIGAAVGMGMILGPLLSGWLVYVSRDSALPFFMAGALGLLNALFLALLLPETNTQPQAGHTFTLTLGWEYGIMPHERAHIRSEVVCRADLLCALVLADHSCLPHS